MLKEIIEVIARERRIEEYLVLQALENIIRVIAVKKYDNKHLKCKILADGSFEVFIFQTVVKEILENKPYYDNDNYYDNGNYSNETESDYNEGETDSNVETETDSNVDNEAKTDSNEAEAEPSRIDVIILEKAQARYPEIKVGDQIREVLPLEIKQLEIKEILAQLKSKLTTLQKEKEFEVFESKIGTIVTGYIKRVDGYEAVISFPEGESILKKSKTLKNDILKPNTYIKLYLEDIKKSFYNQLVLSRTHPEFIKKLFELEVPEISEGLVEIKAVSRDPGSLSKVAVTSFRPSINPAKACIGEYGIRIQNITKELSGEKINIVLWNENINQFIANALSPAQVLKVNQKRDNRFEVVTSQEEFKKAMGRGGQNVILAKRLCAVSSIKLITEEEEQTTYKELVQKQSANLIESLEIEEMMAHLLISEGLETSEIIAECDINEISQLDGFDEELAQILKTRAQDFIKKEKDILKEELNKTYNNSSLVEIDELSTAQIKELLNNKIYTKNDLAMLDASELKELFENKNSLEISFETSCDIISKARGIQRRT